MRRLTRSLLFMYIVTLVTLSFTVPVAADSIGDIIVRGLQTGSNLELDANASSGAARQNETPQSKLPTYAALGDSVAAGLGLPPTTSTESQCGRSIQAYPKLIAASRHVRLVFAACSGATAGDLVTKQAVPGPNITSQLDSAFASGRPDLITITAGANDIHWVSLIQACASQNVTCGNRTSATVDFLIGLYKIKIRAALAAIYVRSDATPPPVYLTGYYSLGSPACLSSQSSQGLTKSEIALLSQQTAKLNSAIQSAASDFSFAHYVPLDFADHGICSRNSHRWVQNLHEPAPFHPTALGQAVIARAILNSL